MKHQPFATSLLAEASYKLGDPILVTFEIENRGTESYQLLDWGTPLENQFTRDFLTVSRDGERLPYQGKRVARQDPSDAAYVLIRPGERLKSTLDISRAYPIDRAGSYTVTLNAWFFDAFAVPGNTRLPARKRHDHERHELPPATAQFQVEQGAEPRLTDTQKAQKAARRAAPDLTAKPPTISGGTTNQQDQMGVAHNNAQYFAALAVAQLTSGTPSTNALYQTWFGAFDQGRYDTVVKTYRDVSDTLLTETVTYDLSGSGCDPSWNAYSYAGGVHTVWTCSGFWTMGPIAIDCQFSTTLHEWTHILDNTDDYAYGDTDCQNLAVNDPAKAVKNADSYENFAERLAVDSDFGKSIMVVTDRDTFGADEIDAMLVQSTPAIIPNALYVQANGFWPGRLGITAADLGNAPTVKPAINVSPSVPGMSITLTSLEAEDSNLPEQPQRFTWWYRVEFANDSGFPTTAGQVNKVTLTATLQGFSHSALLQLIREPNPYELDGPTSWLSTDVRVFQINEGESRFGVTMGSAPADAPTFIQQVIANLNAGTAGGQTFDSLPVDQDASMLELSQVVNAKKVFDFALAKVRYKGTVDISNVRVFFRLFPALTTSVEYNENTTYRRSVQTAKTTPLLGVNAGGDLLTIPCFAEQRVNSAAAAISDQTDPTNVRTIGQKGGTEATAYFGCWLDINQTDQQFPVKPGTSNGQELVRNVHQCLVAEIAFDPAPIPAQDSPGESDKLAQRNLSIVASANPGEISSRRIPINLEIRPTATAATSPNESPDELMFQWKDTPKGTTATLYLPGVDAANILAMAQSMYGIHRLEQVDEHTLRFPATGTSYMPVPPAIEGGCVGLLALDLPEGVRKGQEFHIVVRQITDTQGEPPVIIESPKIEASPIAADARAVYWRKVLGTFQLTVPVQDKETMLETEDRRLSVLRWIQKSIPENDRWRPVFDQYVTETANRVDALGGNSAEVKASPSGEDVALRLRILDQDGAFYGEPVDIEVKHRTLESVPQFRFRHVVPTNVFLVKHLRRFPQSDYVVTVTPSHHFHPEGRFVTIPPSGTAELTFVFAKRAHATTT